MNKPLAIDLYCGLGGWAEGFLAEGYRVIGFDIERRPYPGQLVLQDVTTLHGSQFRDAAVIVASPPCQFFSYTAMPWKRAKELAERTRSAPALLRKELALFDACFRIQREASAAAGRHIPMVVENVRGAVKWVGPAQGKYGSYYLWGDVPALIPVADSKNRGSGHKVPGMNFHEHEKTGKPGRSFQSAAVEYTGVKAPGMNWSDRSRRGQDFTRIAGQQATKNNGGSWFAVAHNKESGHSRNPDGRDPMAATSGQARKMASALIAKIPFRLARHIARVHKHIDERKDHHEDQIQRTGRVRQREARHGF